MTTPTAALVPSTPDEAGSPRRFLMCPPDSFAVRYRINPWMDPALPVDGRRAMTQWQNLRTVLEDLGHQVEVIEPHTGLPDMVFAANAAVVIGNRAVAARMAHVERQGEEDLYRSWLVDHGITDVCVAQHPNEGEGDFVLAGGGALAGTGFRTTLAAHRELAQAFGLDVTSVHLADARWYHLDMALVALDDQTVAYFPDAFTPPSRRILAQRFPDAILATRDDALAFGLNAISDGRHVVMPEGARHLVRELAVRGYEPIPIDVSEFHRAGGSAKCCVLELHPPRAST